MSWWYEVDMNCEHVGRKDSKVTKVIIGRSDRLTSSEVFAIVRECMEDEGEIVKDTYKINDIIERCSEDVA